MTIGDDGTAFGRRGTLAFDHEGTAPVPTILVQHGVVVGHVHSRITAARAGTGADRSRPRRRSRAPARARLGNTYVASGQGELADLLADDSRSACTSPIRWACRSTIPAPGIRAGLARMIRQGRARGAGQGRHARRGSAGAARTGGSRRGRLRVEQRRLIAATAPRGTTPGEHRRAARASHRGAGGRTGVIGLLLDAATRRVRACRRLRDDRCHRVGHARRRRWARWSIARAFTPISGSRMTDGVASRCEPTGMSGRMVAAAIASARNGPGRARCCGRLPAPLPAVRHCASGRRHPRCAGTERARGSARGAGSPATTASFRPGPSAPRAGSRSPIRGVSLAGYDTTMVGVGLSVARPVGDRTALAPAAPRRRCACPMRRCLASLAAEADEMLGAPVLEDSAPGATAPDLARAPRARRLSRPAPAGAPGTGRLVRPRRALTAAWATGSSRIRSACRMIRSRTGRPGSRPIDDDGVVTQRRTLIDRGDPQGRAHRSRGRRAIRSAGHGSRATGRRARGPGLDGPTW